jgi:adenylate cyclase
MSSPAPEPPPGTVSIRWSLFRNLGLLVLGLAIAILATTALTSYRIVSITSEHMIERSLERTAVEMATHFDPIRSNLQAAQSWTTNGVLDPDDPDSLNRLFLPVLEAFSQISSVNIGDSEGRSWMLLRQGDGWRNRIGDPSRWGHSLHFREFAEGGHALREWRVENPAPEERYDPRTRAWYRSAQDGAQAVEPQAELPREIYWTDPYVFFTTKEPGITAAVHARTADGRRLVVAFDVLLREISEFTSGLAVSRNGFATILAGDRRIVGLPRLPQLREPEARERALLQHPEDLGIPVLRDAVRARLEQELDRASRTMIRFPFESDGEAWWAGGQAVHLHPDRSFALIVAMPERDMLGPIDELRVFVVVLSLLALSVAVLMALQLARLYSRPLARLADNSERIRQLELATAMPVESTIREVSLLAGAQERMRTALDSFVRYVPSDVVRELLERGDAARLGGARETLSILFTDVEGFTSIAERMTPETITAHMAEYFEALLPIIDEYGTVDKLIGDAIVAFWGAPTPDADHARHAVEATLACSDRLDELNAGWERSGRPALPTRFGLNCGPAMVGNVGSRSRLSYTAVGDSMNLAARLEGLNKFYGTRILAAEPLPEQAGDAFVWRRVDRVSPKGKTEAVELFELLGRTGEVPPERMEFSRRYEEALDLYRGRRWREALDALDALPPENAADLSVLRLRDGCQACLHEPPGDAWQAVTSLDRK